MHMFGLGKWMIKRKMKASNVQWLQRMLAAYVELAD